MVRGEERQTRALLGEQRRRQLQLQQQPRTLAENSADGSVDMRDCIAQRAWTNRKDNRLWNTLGKPRTRRVASSLSSSPRGFQSCSEWIPPPYRSSGHHAHPRPRKIQRTERVDDLRAALRGVGTQHAWRELNGRTELGLRH